MLTGAKVRSFQSLRSVDIELAPLTVITGASNSGKSALLRALRTLTLNSRSADFVPPGASVSVIDLSLASDLPYVNGQPGPDDTVRLKRGPGHSTYAILPLSNEALASTYPKSGATVPDDVAALLRLTPTNFSTQFDRPFLLDVASTDIARTLGALSNINVIHAAQREANRRLLETRKTLKLRHSDRDSLNPALDAARSIPPRRQALDKALSLLSQASSTQADINVLQRSLTDAQLSLTELSHVRAHLADHSRRQPPIPPRTEELATSITELRRLLTETRQNWTSLNNTQSMIPAADEAVAQAGQTHHAILKETGTCPTCGQTIP